MTKDRYFHIARHLVEKFFAYWYGDKGRPLVDFQGETLSVDLLTGRQYCSAAAMKSNLASLDKFHFWFQRQLLIEQTDIAEIVEAVVEIKVGWLKIVEKKVSDREALEDEHGNTLRDSNGSLLVKETTAIRQVHSIPIRCESRIRAGTQMFGFMHEIEIDLKGELVVK